VRCPEEKRFCGCAVDAGDSDALLARLLAADDGDLAPRYTERGRQDLHELGVRRALDGGRRQSHEDRVTPRAGKTGFAGARNHADREDDTASF
jgi:hypothetical protein